MLTVWGRRNSFNLQKVMWLVGELELPHTHIPAGGSYGGLDVKRPSVPHVEAWYRRLQERSAYREHIMVPFDELYGRLDY
jgi:glutathione S-transferase